MLHASNQELAIAIGPLLRGDNASLRKALRISAQAGFNAIQLDATAPGVRPRELNERARRDLAATLSRAGLRAVGIDLFIPRRHFNEPSHQDRAVEATLAGLHFAADLGRLPLSIALPISSLDATIAGTLVEAADLCDVTLAVHAEDQLAALADWLDEINTPLAAAAIDPAALLLSGVDPLNAAMTLGDRLAVARLSDAEPGQSAAEAEGARVAPGDGALDLRSYRVTLDTGAALRQPVVLDLRGLRGELAGPMAGASTAWSRAGALPD